MIIAVPEFFTAPTSPADWDLYYDAAVDKVYVWDGSSWQEITEEARVRDSDRLGLSLTRVRYAGQDFGTLFDEAQAYLQEQFPDDWKAWIFSNGGVAHLAYACYLAQGINWYQNQRATDRFLPTAMTANSAQLSASYLGYKVKGAAAAATDLEVTIPQTPTLYGFPVPILRGHVFYGPDDMTYLAVADVVFTGSQVTKTVSVAEGVKVSESFVSTGETNQIFNLQVPPDGQYIVQGSFYVTVDAGYWPEFDFLPLGNSAACEVGYTADPPYLRFGDGIVGKVPRYGAGINVTYALCSGEAGKVIEGSITSADSVVVGFTTIPLTVSQPDPAVGGTGYESLVSIKANAPRMFATGKRAVTGADFLVSVVGYPTTAGVVSEAQVIVPRTLGEDPTAHLAMVELHGDAVALGLEVVALGALQTTATDTVADLSTAVAEFDTPLATIGVYTGLETTRLGEITTYLANLAQVKTSLSDTVTRLSDGLSALDAGLVQVNAIVNGASPDPSSPVYIGIIKTQVATLINQMRSLYTDLTGVDGSVSAERALLLQQVALIALMELNRSRINQSCFDAVQGLQTCNTAVITQKAQIELSQATLESEVSSAQSIAAAIGVVKDAISVRQQDIWSYVEMTKDDGHYVGALADHLDGLFALNCGSNVVQIPCLTKDRNGFYAAPSQALLDALQTRIDSLKLVEVSARPIDGSTALVPVTVDVWLFIDGDYVEETIRLEAVARIEDLLKDRKFGASLVKTDVSRILIPPDDNVPAIAGIEGVRWGEIRLTVPLTHRAKLIAGNVFPGADGVITKGAVNVDVNAIKES